MANYNSFTRTNYFRVTDEDKYQKLFETLCAEDTIHDFTEKDELGLLHGFGVYGSLCCGEDFDAFLENMRYLLPNGQAMIITEVGYEKLRYLAGYSTIVTNKGIWGVNLYEETLKKAQEVLGDSSWDTQFDY